MRAGHMIIESCATLVCPSALVTLKLWGIPRAPLIVILHTTHTPTLGLASLHGGKQGHADHTASKDTLTTLLARTH